MRVRIKKAPPAPMMDGYDVRRFQFNRVYQVPERIGRYLIVAGYAEISDRIERSADRARKRKR